MILQDILEVLEFIGPERMAIFAENLIKKEECAVGRDKILGHHTRMIICCLETGIFVCSSVYFVLLDASRRDALFGFCLSSLKSRDSDRLSVIKVRLFTYSREVLYCTVLYIRPQIFELRGHS